MKLADIGEAVAAVGRRFDGFSGNCARFAAVLNRILEAGGDYVVVDSGHYEYVDHVLLSFKGRLLDASGSHTRSQVRQQWCEDGETLDGFPDASEDGRDVRRLVDPDGPLAAKWDEEDLEEALREALGRPSALRPAP